MTSSANLNGSSGSHPISANPAAVTPTTPAFAAPPDTPTLQDLMQPFDKLTETHDTILASMTASGQGSGSHSKDQVSIPVDRIAWG